MSKAEPTRWQTTVQRWIIGGLAVLLVGLHLARAQVSPDESLKSLQPADGLEVSLWAQEPMVNNPTSIDIDSRGRVWIAEGQNYRLWAKREKPFQRVPGADRIKILQDRDGDGKADGVTVFAADVFPVPMGLAVEEIWQAGQYRGARVYVGNSPNLLVLEDTDGDDRADRRFALLTGFGGIDSDHGLHGMALGPDGKLYFTQGDGRFGTDQLQERDVTFDVRDKSGRRLRSAQFGTTLRVNLDGTELEVIADRQRNNYETCVDSFGHVFTSDNDDDGDLGCRMLWIMAGGNYGYRMPGSSRHWAEELPGVVPKLVGTGNGSPAGILVYEGDLFPEPYRGAVLQLDAGTHQVNVHPLQRFGAAFRSAYRVLLRGADPWFRPVDAAVAPDGSLYVCDWYDGGVGGNRLSDQDTGRIYRVKPKGIRPRAGALDLASIQGAIEALKSPNVATRFAARQALLAQGAAARAPLRALYRRGRPHERARALFVLADLPQTGRADAAAAALKDADPRLRELALHILASDLRRQSVVEPAWAKRVEPRAVAVLPQILPLADDPDAGVRRELLLALRDVPTARAGEALLRLAAGWDGKDRYYLEALHLALKDREPELLARLFSRAVRPALAAGPPGGPVALPPYFPTTTNDAFLRIGVELPPASAASKLIGLAWGLGRCQALPALRALLETTDSPEISHGVDLALDQLDDPRAAELLIDQFLGREDPDRQRQILRRLGSKLGGAWKPVLDRPKMHDLFAAALASDDLRIEAIKTIARCGARRYAPRLLAWAGDKQQDLSTRAAALEALGRLHYPPARDMAGRLVQEARGQPQGGPLAQAALAALNDFQGPQGQQLLQSILDNPQYPLDFRRRAAQVLAATRSGANHLLALHRQNRIPAELNTEVTFLLHHHPDPQVRRAARQQIPLPKTASGKRIEDLDQVLALQADPEKGRAVFLRDRSDGCARCHRVQGVGNWVGPDLSSIGIKYGKSELLFHILNPSSAINFNYVSYALALADGRVLTGLITDETADQVVLKTAQGDRLVIPRDQIEQKQPQNISLMPENLVQTMTEQDLADLVAYLATLRQPVSPVGQYYLLGPLPEGALDGTAVPDLQAGWAGPGGRRLRWQRVQASRDQYLDLSSLLRSEKGQEVYCFVPLISGSRQDARLVLNTANAVALWHNGRPVAVAGPRPSGDATLWEGSVQLRRGTNALVIRLRSGPLRAGLITTVITERAIRFAFDRVDRRAVSSR